MDDVEDVDIALLIMDEDQEGLRHLLDKYGGKAKRYLHRNYGGVLSPIELNEALYTATHKVWRNIAKFDDRKGKLGGWFLRIVQHCAVDIIRRQDKYQEHEVPMDERLFEDTISLEESSVPDSNKKLKRAFNEAVEKLPTLQQAIIKADLAADEGKADAARIAEIHGTTASSVRVSRHKAKDALKRALTEAVDEQTKRRRS